MDNPSRMRSLVDEHYGFVARTLRKAGVPPSELDDEVQRTFITLARRIADVRLGAERSFLFQVAINTAAHARRDLDRIVDSMDESLRVVFTLNAFEGMDLAEIATVLGLPRGTAASRLRRARAYIREHVTAIEIADELGAPGAGEIEGPPLLRREKKPTALRRALLEIGVSVPTTASASAKTLAVLGLA